MELSSAIPTAGDLFKQAVRGIDDDQLGAQTPCSEYDVRALFNHVLYWAPVLEAGATKTDPPTDRPGERETDLVGEDWRGQLAGTVDTLVAAWSAPQAWEGMGKFGAAELPASMLGTMLFTDLTVHSWDLTRVSGADCAVPEDLGTLLLSVAEQLAPQGRKGGAFGEEVPVPQDAPPFERALGLFGRNPAWSR
ncbi:TIGR03086 family metal-binding protein [Sciscionella sediminilitoris]|uniref:TIGR03086 family metal-binding protein n=1 Tax=Sciscionella sediminilitoris TaxID=1445613 RepID=UPI00068DE7A6|nr:TIGR03086 family metal-binding protein [Sciscionella sp. SE31]